MTHHHPFQPQKRHTLRRHGTLNPHPETVSHALFRDSDFFAADDLMQVKYEMLRQVHIDHRSISQSAQAFGFSRPSFYQAQAAFQEHGVFGLLPQKRGPQSGHKLTTEVMEFVARQRSTDPSPHPSATGRFYSEPVSHSGPSAQHSAPLAAAKKTTLDTIILAKQFRCPSVFLRGSPRTGAVWRPRTRVRSVSASRHVRVDGSLSPVHRGCCCHRTCCGYRPPSTAAARYAIRDRRASGRHVFETAMGDSSMNHDAHQKVKASHLKRNAYLYVRQSTLRQC